MMTARELLGLPETAGEEVVRTALDAARVRWQRRRDVATTPETRERAEAALARLAEIAATLGAPTEVAATQSSQPASLTDQDILAELARRREMQRHEAERRARGSSALPPSPPPVLQQPETAEAAPSPPEVTPLRDRRSNHPPPQTPSTVPGAWPLLLPLLGGLLVIVGLFSRSERPVHPAPTLTPPFLAEAEAVPGERTRPRRTLPPAPRAPHLSGPAKLLADGAKAWQEGRHTIALENFTAAGRSGADPAIAEVGRALALISLGKSKDAETACRKALKTRPELAAAHYNLGVALHRQGQGDLAAKAFRRFLELAPGDSAAPRARGYLARRTMRRVPLLQPNEARRIIQEP
ncbi:MAG: tetratricopeptide repeat protein [Candidatus Sericytochromatia bacterium]|nr:tetratricopeptide repeat protein [Candidatus Sericytochromatia bacterium]